MANKPKKCNPSISHSCGDACIEREDKCRIDMPPETNKSLGIFSKLIERVAGPKKEDFDTESIGEALVFAAAGIKTKREKEVDDRAISKLNREKALKEDRSIFGELKDAGLTDQEAEGLYAFLGQGYKTKETFPAQPVSKIEEDIQIRAGQALRKLHKFNPADIEDKFDASGKKIDRISATGLLKKELKISESDMESFLAPYKESLMSGDDMLEERMFTASAMNNYASGISRPNVVLEIQAISDSTGKGVMVEDYKNRSVGYQGEIAFPAGTKFVVTKIEESLPNPPIPIKSKLKDADLKEISKLPKSIFNPSKIDTNGNLDYVKGAQKLFSAAYFLTELRKAIAKGDKSAVAKFTAELDKLKIPKSSYPSEEAIKKVISLKNSFNKQRKENPQINGPTKIHLQEVRDFYVDPTPTSAKPKN